MVLRQDDGLDQLVAFLVPEKGAPLDPKTCARRCARRCRPIWCRRAIEMRDVLPRLSSGKVDRKALKKEPLTAPASAEEQEDPQSRTEASARCRQKGSAAADHAVRRRFLHRSRRPFAAGRALRLASCARRRARRRHACRTCIPPARLRAIAALLDEKAASAARPKDLSFTPPPLLRRFLCGLAQAICLPFILALSTAQWLGIFVSYMLLTDTDASFWQEVASLLGVYVIVNIFTVILAIAVKWIVIGRFKPGRYRSGASIISAGGWCSASSASPISNGSRPRR